MWILSLLCLPAPAQDAPLSYETQVIAFPGKPVAKAEFGQSVAVGDVTGDRKLDIVIGASGLSTIYVAEEGDQGYAVTMALQASGRVKGDPVPDETKYGDALHLAQLDDDPPLEIVVGALEANEKRGRVVIHGLASQALVIEGGEKDRNFGRSVTSGDFNGDGKMDVAIGSPGAEVAGEPAGAITLLFGPIDPAGNSARRQLPNPVPSANGNFGHVVTTSDWNGDGHDDLVVSAVGNTVGEAKLAGEVFVFPGPLDAKKFVRLHDNHRPEGDLPRFGMHIAARDNMVAVGSPRRDWAGVKDAGMAAWFRNEEAEDEGQRLRPHPTPFKNGILGFRVMLVDWVGNEELDLLVATLPLLAKPDGKAERPNRGFYVWDGSKPEAGPTRMAALEGSGDHFPQGVAATQLIPGGREELIIGDPSHYVGKRKDVGRVVIYSRE